VPTSITPRYDRWRAGSTVVDPSAGASTRPAADDSSAGGGSGIVGAGAGVGSGSGREPPPDSGPTGATGAGSGSVSIVADVVVLLKVVVVVVETPCSDVSGGGSGSSATSCNAGIADSPLPRPRTSARNRPPSRETATDSPASTGIGNPGGCGSEGEARTSPPRGNTTSSLVASLSNTRTPRGPPAVEVRVPG